jgi:hypothetical protein
MSKSRSVVDDLSICGALVLDEDVMITLLSSFPVMYDGIVFVFGSRIN